VLGVNLEILPPDVAVHVLVFDPNVWEVDLVIEIRQVALTRPFLDLFHRAIGAAITVAIASIALLQKSLVLASQLAVELHAKDSRLTRLQPFGSL
jgi:hypothetical protein